MAMVNAARRRRTFAEVAAAAARAERTAAIEFIRDTIAATEGLQRRGRVSALEASMLKRRLDAIADGLAAGLHL